MQLGKGELDHSSTPESSMLTLKVKVPPLGRSSFGEPGILSPTQLQGWTAGCLSFLSCASLLICLFRYRTVHGVCTSVQHITPTSLDFYALWNVDAGASATCHLGALSEDYIAGASLKAWVTEECGCL
jgi:hypothetical protein